MNSQGFIIEGLKQALTLLITCDKEVLEISWVSLKCSGVATVLATLMGMPLGFLIGYKNFWGKKFLTTTFNTLMALPTVIVGLTLYSLFSRQGPLGSANLLYTQTAIIVGEFILIFPVIVALTIAGVQSVDKRVDITARTLGAKTTQLVFSILWEAKISLISAFVNAFGRVIAELGIAIMLGGNIRGSTRTLTTAIALETSRGEFALAIALGFILLFLACGVNIVLQLLQRRAG